MAMICWKMREHMSSSSDKRFKDLDYHIKEWYRTVSRIATKLLRGHGYQQKYLRRESDGLSARWSALCNAIQHDHHYYGHPSTAQVTIAESCLPLSNMEAMSIRGIYSSPHCIKGLLIGCFLPFFTDFSDFLGRLHSRRT